jgi:hypothetical protein
MTVFRRKRLPALRRIRGAFAAAVALVALEAVPVSPATPVAEAHANCEGTDHWHWHIGWAFVHRDHWIYMRSENIDRYHYRNYFWNETDGYGDWSESCPS